MRKTFLPFGAPLIEQSEIDEVVVYADKKNRNITNIELSNQKISIEKIYVRKWERSCRTFITF